MAYTDMLQIQMINDVMRDGIWSYNEPTMEARTRWKDGEVAHYKSIFGYRNEYQPSQAFPLTELRDMNFEALVDEILWIFQRKSNNVKDLNSKIWNQWADERGSIGRAYGYQIAKPIDYAEGTMDQFDKVLYDIKNKPWDRGIMTNIFIPEDIPHMNLRPCAFGTHWRVLGGALHLKLMQRSSDLITANNWNVAQYAVLQAMVAQVFGLRVGKLIHDIGDLHIYDRHLDAAEEMKRRYVEFQHTSLPQLVIDPDVKNFYDFRVEHFKLVDYNPMGKISIPVAE